MAVSDVTVYVMIASFFNYLLVYKKNLFWGNLFFIGIGLGLLYLGTGSSEKVFGFIFMFGAIASFVYDYARINTKDMSHR